MKKLTSLLLAVLLLAMAIPSMAEEPVHLRIATWTSNEDQLKLLSSFVDEFAQAKGIAIEPEFISLSGTEYSSLPFVLRNITFSGTDANAPTIK